MPADSTNLAAEFHVLSILHRLGANAALTLANKKMVDIVVAREPGRAVTLDVKGAAGTTGFFVNNQVEPRDEHFVVFVSYYREHFIGDSPNRANQESDGPGGSRLSPINRSH